MPRVESNTGACCDEAILAGGERSNHKVETEIFEEIIICLRAFGLLCMTHFIDQKRGPGEQSKGDGNARITLKNSAFRKSSSRPARLRSMLIPADLETEHAVTRSHKNVSQREEMFTQKKSALR